MLARPFVPWLSALSLFALTGCTMLLGDFARGEIASDGGTAARSAQGPDAAPPAAGRPMGQAGGAADGEAGVDASKRSRCAPRGLQSDDVPARVLRFDGHMRQRHGGRVRRVRRELRGVQRGTGLQRGHREMRVHRRVVHRRMLRRDGGMRDLRGQRRLRYRRSGVRGVRFGNGVRRRSLRLRRRKSCAGCCDGNTCVLSGSQGDSQCGSAGNACGKCASGQACENGACTCGGAACSGCCDATGQCVASSTKACGLGGVTCQACGATEECNPQGKCVCDANTCPSGCCNASGQCVTSESATCVRDEGRDLRGVRERAGVQRRRVRLRRGVVAPTGAATETRASPTAARTNGACGHRGNPACAPCAGGSNACGGGECLCDSAASCGGGCCSGSTCIAGGLGDGYCGSGGAACSSCSAPGLLRRQGSACLAGPTSVPEAQGTNNATNMLSSCPGCAGTTTRPGSTSWPDQSYYHQSTTCTSCPTTQGGPRRTSGRLSSTERRTTSTIAGNFYSFSTGVTVYVVAALESGGSVYAPVILSFMSNAAATGNYERVELNRDGSGAAFVFQICDNGTNCPYVSGRELERRVSGIPWASTKAGQGTSS